MTSRLLLATLLALATDMTLAQTQSTILSPQPMGTTQNRPGSKVAAQWGLTTEEWTDYQHVMRHRRGVWSPGLDPITALGVSADTTAERKRFAELYVRTEFERTRKELAFQLAVDSAWKRLYPETPRIGPRAVAQVATEAPGRYALIVSPDCEACTTLLQQRLDTLVFEAKEGVDVHVVGTNNNDQILRDWIATQPKLLAALKNGGVTVNHGNQFKDLSQFPAIYSKTRSGQWTREL
jgi:integrating conjugative element protein (TIGR03759 family)